MGLMGKQEGGQKKLMQLAIPLIIGFKLAGIIVAAMTALKVLVFKTVFMSGLAIVASLALAAKSLYDRMKNKSAQAPAGHATPYAYYPGLAAQADMSWDPSNAAGYEIHDLGAASGGLGGGLGAAADLSHFGTDFQASYATHTGFSGAGAGATQGLRTNGSSGFVPASPHVIPGIYLTN
ncbi:unnamed protein product [Nesidiocoris tenuis]|uniref:Uncharacterized protein n=1 Tax=Nesidiocoris tenuis TaxID=355587 RepID=A0A6H5H3T6_9HEMI|nr:unnamed protein product [Nesidiocoris tenuis]